jgi:molecular chaperone IbpA
MAHLPWDQGYPKYEKPKLIEKPINPFDTLRPFLESWTVGFDQQFSLLEQLRNSAKTVTYPPYNIKEVEQGSEYEIEMAVAGFKRDDIDITLENGSLKIEGGSKDSTSENYVHKGIAARTFSQTFALAEHVEVKGAKLEDGILTVSLIRKLPKEKMPKRIEIK